jgi:hypothetical protein
MFTTFWRPVMTGNAQGGAEPVHFRSGSARQQDAGEIHGTAFSVKVLDVNMIASLPEGALAISFTRNRREEGSCDAGAGQHDQFFEGV